jgi:hypothetical protein
MIYSFGNNAIRNIKFNVWQRKITVKGRWRATVLHILKDTLRQLPGGTSENYRKHHGSRLPATLGPVTLRIPIRIFTDWATSIGETAPGSVPQYSCSSHLSRTVHVVDVSCLWRYTLLQQTHYKPSQRLYCQFNKRSVIQWPKQLPFEFQRALREE